MAETGTRPPASTRGDVLAATGIALVGTALVAVLDPNEGGHYPTCPLLAITGLYCPFCGGLRAAHDLTRLDVLGALDRNPLFVVALPLILWAWWRWARRAFTGKPEPLALPSWWGWALLAVLGVYFVARNLPGMGWLSPA
ncbi:DUF2752 domain-containing protein [Marmoricola sp. RAF53]|uniref:DUF2752 domain-containing protein n=1 Tax=Marmoricola sp. RAF53 TaxID=3233059 RepID=UPI003F988FC1